MGRYDLSQEQPLEFLKNKPKITNEERIPESFIF